MRFNRENLAKLKYVQGGPETQQVWGSGEDKNLGVALSPKGDHVWISRVYVVQANQRTKKRIGRLFRRPLSIRDKSIEEARRENSLWRVEAAQGIDPIEKRRPVPGSGSEKEGPPTVSILMRTYVRERVEPELEPTTARRYRSIIHHIEKHFGSIPTAELGKAQLLAVRKEMAATRQNFNQLRKLLGAAYRLADRLGWTWGGEPMVPVGYNPFHSVLGYEKQVGQRAGDPFEPEEVARLLGVAEELLRPRAKRGKAMGRGTVAMPIFLLYTGLRVNEALGLAWEKQELPKSSGYRGWIDRRRNVIRLTFHKTSGKTGSREVPLAPQALRVLETVAGLDETWVFPTRLGGQQKTKNHHSWKALLERAGVRHRGIHQTRHTFITRALEAGSPIAAVAKAVGHSTTHITEVYSHISDRTAREAAERAGHENPLNWSWMEAPAA